jgi:hypothetical protein
MIASSTFSSPRRVPVVESWLATETERSGATIARTEPCANARISATDAKFIDYDNDGWLDVAASGTPSAAARAVRLLHNDGRGGFIDVEPDTGIGAIGRPSGIRRERRRNLDLIMPDRAARAFSETTAAAPHPRCGAARWTATGSRKNNDLGSAQRSRFAADLSDARSPRPSRTSASGRI